MNITAENKGLDCDLHLTVNGGNINIYAGNNGINTSEDSVSVFTMNGGSVYVENTGVTGQGNGIDSNGWIVVNGGTIVAGAWEASQGSGVDSDLGIITNGGTALGYGSMYDEMESEVQPFVMLSFMQTQDDVTIQMYDADGALVATLAPTSAFSVPVYTFPTLTAGEYTFYLVNEDGNRSLLSGGASQTGGMGGMTPSEGFDPSQAGGGFGGTASASATQDVFTLAVGSNLFYSVSTDVPTYTGLPFSDIANTDSYYEAVKFLYDQSVMLGTSDSTFSPNEEVSRAMAITVLGRLL